MNQREKLIELLNVDMSGCEGDYAEEMADYLLYNGVFVSNGVSVEKGISLKVKLDPLATMPTRAHEADAGYDLYSRETKKLRAWDSAVFDTGVHIQIPEGYVGFIKSKSGLNVKCGLTSEGVIDSGYTGSIRVKLYNNGEMDYKIMAGDKISQLVILPVFTPKLELVDTLEETERGDSGFGSTGK